MKLDFTQEEIDKIVNNCPRLIKKSPVLKDMFTCKRCEVLVFDQCYTCKRLYCQACWGDDIGPCHLCEKGVCDDCVVVKDVDHGRNEEFYCKPCYKLSCDWDKRDFDERTSE